MRAGIALREDYDAAQLRSLAKATRNAGQSRRLLALAEIYDGGSRTKAAQVGGVGLQTIRDWVVRFNARGPDGLIDGKAPGNTCKLNDSQRQAVAEGERPDAGDPWRGSLAAEGFDPVGLGGVPDLAQRDDAEPRIARARLPQALGPPAPLCPEP
jgi:hypothetical protein